MFHSSYKAFTLIELLIVIALIGILSGIATVAYSGIQARGRDTQRKNDLNELKIALSTYYNSVTPSQYVASSTATPPAEIAINGGTDALSAALEPNFIRSVPVDPLNSGNYMYKYQSYLTGSVNSDYKLFATLETTTDKKGWGGGTQWVTDGYVVQNE